MRDGDWKLIRFFEDSHEELYNLREDIGETKNLTETEPEKRAELSVKLTAWSEEIEALIPEPNPQYVVGSNNSSEVEKVAVPRYLHLLMTVRC